MVILKELNFAMTCQYHSEIHISNPLKIKKKNASGVLKRWCYVIVLYHSYLTSSHSTEQDNMTDEINAVLHI